MRLNRFLALAGVASRRGAEEFIRHGRVTVNGKTAQDLSTQVATSDRVQVDGRVVRPQNFVYLLLNKPPSYLTTRSDDRARKTIYDLLPTNLPRLAHAGRLDLESEGLLLLTNDGTLILESTHPRHGLAKEYAVTLDRDFEAADVSKVRKGVYLAEGRAWFDEVHRVGPGQIRVVLRQGIKRQIRRVLAALDYKVRRLVRVRIGPVTADGLRTGEFRELTPQEVAALRDGGEAAPGGAGANRTATGVRPPKPLRAVGGPVTATTARARGQARPSVTPRGQRRTK